MHSRALEGLREPRTSTCVVRCFRRFGGVEDSSALEDMIFGDLDGISILVKGRGSKKLLEPVLADGHAFDGNRLLR